MVVPLLYLTTLKITVGIKALLRSHVAKTPSVAIARKSQGKRVTCDLQFAVSASCPSMTLSLPEMTHSERSTNISQRNVPTVVSEGVITVVPCNLGKVRN